MKLLLDKKDAQKSAVQHSDVFLHDFENLSAKI